MANTLTPNLGLKKPSGDMNVSRADMNDNWDAIDAADLTQRGTEIAANTDLDTLTTPGKYYSPNSQRSATLTNTPFTGGGFSLLVLKQGSGGTNFVIQILTVNSDATAVYAPYYRANFGAGFKAWHHLASEQRILCKLTVTDTTNANGNLTITLPRKGIVTAAWTTSSNTMVTVFPSGSSDENGSTTWYAHVTDVSATPAAKTSTQFTAHVLYIAS